MSLCIRRGPWPSIREKATQGGQPVPEDLATYFIMAGGIVGLALGLFGLAPLVFHGRLSRRAEMLRFEEERVSAAEAAMAAEEERRAALWGVLVESRRPRLGLGDSRRPAAAAFTPDPPEAALEL